MIDIENRVFSYVAETLREAYGKNNIFLASEETAAPARFPAAIILEADNSVYKKARDTKIENAAKLLYDVDVYSNKEGYKKAEAQDIMNLIDSCMERLGFTRTMCTPASNLMDAKVYRMKARYEGVVDTSGRIYTN